MEHVPMLQQHHPKKNFSFAIKCVLVSNKKTNMNLISSRKGGMGYTNTIFFARQYCIIGHFG
jgi:hypothetical protein